MDPTYYDIGEVMYYLGRAYRANNNIERAYECLA